MAARAGVAKTTLYRRWSSKDELAVSMLEHLLGPLPAAEELDASVTWLAERVRDPGTRHVLVTLTGQAAQDPDLRALLRGRMRDPYVAALRRSQGASEGAAALAFDVVVGTLLHRAAMDGDLSTLDVEEVSALARSVLATPAPRG